MKRFSMSTSRCDLYHPIRYSPAQPRLKMFQRKTPIYTNPSGEEICSTQCFNPRGAEETNETLLLDQGEGGLFFSKTKTQILKMKRHRSVKISGESHLKKKPRGGERQRKEGNKTASAGLFCSLYIPDGERGDDDDARADCFSRLCSSRRAVYWPPDVALSRGNEKYFIKREGKKYKSNSVFPCFIFILKTRFYSYRWENQSTTLYRRAATLCENSILL